MLLAATFVTINDKLERSRKLRSLIKVHLSEVEADIAELERLRDLRLAELDEAAKAEASASDFVPADSLDQETADRPRDIDYTHPDLADDYFDDALHGWRAA